MDYLEDLNCCDLKITNFFMDGKKSWINPLKFEGYCKVYLKNFIIKVV